MIFRFYIFLSIRTIALFLLIDKNDKGLELGGWRLSVWFYVFWVRDVLDNFKR